MNKRIIFNLLLIENKRDLMLISARVLRRAPPHCYSAQAASYNAKGRNNAHQNLVFITPTSG
ncbi:hypothetical protein [Alloprevotella tannerae]